MVIGFKGESTGGLNSTIEYKLQSLNSLITPEQANQCAREPACSGCIGCSSAIH